MSDVLTDLTDLLYESLASESGLAPFLAAYTKAVHADMAAVLGHDVTEGSGVIQADSGYDTTWRQRYQEYYSARNLWMTRRRDLLAPGTLVTSQQICPDSILLRSEYYNDFLRPQDLFHGMRGVVAGHADWRAIITVLRARRRGPFGNEELALLRELLPHLRRVLRVHQRLDGLLAVPRAGLAVLDNLSFGVVFLGSDGSALFANTAARALNGRVDGLEVDGGRLVATDRHDNRRLQDAVRRATSAAGGAQPSVAAPVTMRCSGHGSEPTIVLIPLASGWSDQPDRRVGAVAVIGNPAHQLGPSAKALQDLFGLTPAEASIAAGISGGKQLNAIAQKRGVSIHTARAQLKSAFQKMGVQTQADLVRMVLGAIGFVREPALGPSQRSNPPSSSARQRSDRA